MDLQTIASDSTQHQEEEITFPNGQARVYLTSKTAYKNGDGKVVGLIGISRDITERKNAEETAHFLAEASRVLTCSLDHQITLSSLVWLVVPTLADWCSIDLFGDDDELHRLALAHSDPDRLAAAWDIYLNYGPGPQGRAIVTKVACSGKAQLLSEVGAESSLFSGIAPKHEAVARSFGIRSLLSVPLQTRGKCIGALTFSMAESGRRLTSENLGLALELAQRASIAIDNSRLYHQAQRARQQAEAVQKRLAVQHAVISILAEASSVEECFPSILEVIGEHLDWEMGGFWCLQRK